MLKIAKKTYNKKIIKFEKYDNFINSLTVYKTQDISLFGQYFLKTQINPIDRLVYSFI